MKKLFMIAAMTVAGAVSAAEELPAVAFVNVGGAVESGLFAKAVTNFLPGVMLVRSRIMAVDKVDIVNMMNPAVGNAVLGKNVGIAVYFVKEKALPPQLTAPGMWAVVNVRGLEKDADAKTFEKRIDKMVLKGLAFACGFGANQDVGRCVMGAGSFLTLKGIDGTSASYSPFVAFPLMDFLGSRGLLVDPPIE